MMPDGMDFPFVFKKDEMLLSNYSTMHKGGVHQNEMLNADAQYAAKMAEQHPIQG